MAVPSRERDVYTLRLGASERRLLEAAAAQQRVYLAEYIRRNSLRAARKDLQVNGDPEWAGGGVGAPQMNT